MSGPRKYLPPLIAVGGILSLSLVGWLGYQLGRYQAGYDLLDTRRTAEERDAQIAAQAVTIDELERQVAIVETAREIDREAYSRVEANLDELEAQIVDQQEQLRFYQGIVSPEDAVAGLRIQDFELIPGTTEQRYRVALVLVQAMVHNERLSGRVVLTVNGVSGGEPAMLDLTQTAPPELAEGVAYGFRYFQSVEFPLTLPAGFVAESVDVQVIPARGGDVLSENFPWR